MCLTLSPLGNLVSAGTAGSSSGSPQEQSQKESEKNQKLKDINLFHLGGTQNTATLTNCHTMSHKYIREARSLTSYNVLRAAKGLNQFNGKQM